MVDSTSYRKFALCTAELDLQIQVIFGTDMQAHN